MSAIHFIYTVVFYALIIRSEKLSSIPEFSNLIEIEKDDVSASLIANIQIQINEDYSPKKIIGFLEELEKSIKKQYEDNLKENKDSMTDYDLSLTRVEENIHSHSTKINELEEKIDLNEHSKILYDRILRQNERFHNDIKKIIGNENFKQIDRSKKERINSKNKIILKIDKIIFALKDGSSEENLFNFKEMGKHFDGVGAPKEFIYLSNVKNIDKTKLLSYFFALKEKLIKKMKINEEKLMNLDKIALKDKYDLLTNSTLNIIQSTSKLISSQSLLNIKFKEELKGLIEFQSQIIDEKSKLKDWWNVESSNFISLEKKILKNLNGIKRVREYFINNYSKLKRFINKQKNR